MNRKKGLMLVAMILVASMLMGTISNAEADHGGSKRAVVFVIDNSGSMWSRQESRDKALRNIAELAIGEDIQVGAVYFGNEVYKTLELTSVETWDGCKKVVEFLSLNEKDENNRGTNIGKALAAASTLLDTAESDSAKSIILLSDGINDNVNGDVSYREEANQLTEKMAKELQQKDVALCCVYLQKSKNDEKYLKQLVNYFETDRDYTKNRFKCAEGEIKELEDLFFLEEEIEIAIPTTEEVNTEPEKKVSVFGVGGLLGALVLVVIGVWRTQIRRKCKKLFSELDTLYGSITALELAADKKTNMVFAMKEELEKAKEDFCSKYENEFDEELLEVLDENHVLEMETLEKEGVELTALNLQVMTRKAEVLSHKCKVTELAKARNSSSKNGALKEMRDKLLQMVAWYTETEKKLNKKENMIKKQMKDLELLEEHVKALEKEPITSSLMLKWKDHCGSHKTAGKKCYYVLGDAKMYNSDAELMTLYEIFGEEEKIFVSNFSSDEKNGLVLKSRVPFAIRNVNEGSDMRKTTCAKLETGEAYELRTKKMKGLQLEVR